MVVLTSTLLLTSCDEIKSSAGVSPADCAPWDNHIARSIPIDLGNGFIVEKDSAVMFSLGGGASSDITVHSCETGEQMTVGTSFSAGPDENGNIDNSRNYDRREIGEEFLEALIAAPAPISLADLASAGQQRGLTPRILPSREQEACGCAAFYPEMLGDQRPYYGRTQ